MQIYADAFLNAAPKASPSVADVHFLNRRGGGFASNDSAEVYLLCPQPAESRLSHFSVYHADRVSVSSTQFVGGDWRWCLSDQNGATLVEAGGYPSEAHCREAVAILQARSGRATTA
jgi:uncharacterized protein YegP (UPF0339 family)